MAAGVGQSIIDTVGTCENCACLSAFQIPCATGIVSRGVLTRTLAEGYLTWLFVPMPWRQRNRMAVVE